MKGLMSGLGSAEAIFRLKLISLEKCFIAGVGSSLDSRLRPANCTPRSVSSSGGADRVLQEPDS